MTAAAMPYWRLSGFYFLYFAFLGTWLPYWNLYLKSLDYSAHAIGLMTAIMLGTKAGAERVLAWQFAGTNEKGEAVRGSWKCLSLDGVSQVRLRDGPWHAGDSHKLAQTCLDNVDLDANPASPYRPLRS